MALNEDQNLECPLCMEPFEVDDLNFFPCTCGYQICRFCWHRIRTDENGLCPACRKQYPEDPADFKPLSAEELQKIKSEKKQKDNQRKKMSESKKHLANVRVVQKNLVFVVGLPTRLADADTLKKHDYFGKFGKLHKVVVNQSTSYAGSQGPSASAYVTYCRPEDALRAIKNVNNIHVDGRTIKASLGTTKYCSHFLKNQQCPKNDCMYLHELGDEAASFTKEDMQQGKHQEYERKLQDQILGCNSRKQCVSPIPENNKESWSCTALNGKEHRAKTKDSAQSNKSEKPSRSKAKHENQRRRGKNRSSDSNHNGNSSKGCKEESGTSKKNHKLSRHTKTSIQMPLQRVEEAPKHHGNRKTVDVPETDMENSQTTYVEIMENNSPSHQSASIKISRCGSPSLPPSPASSSSSLFTPFGSLSSNFLSSSPSPPPCNSAQMFQITGTSSSLQDPNPVSAYSNVDIEHRKSPCQFIDSLETSDSVFSHLNNLPLSQNLRFIADQQQNEDQMGTNESDSQWNTSYSFDYTAKNQEDDLDFDPWNESSKGLADLMAREANTNLYKNANLPPGFSSYKTVPNAPKLSVPPPGFRNHQHSSINATSNVLHNSYGINSAYNNRLFNEKKQSSMDTVPHVFHHSSQNTISGYCKEFNDYSSDMNSRLKELLQMKELEECQGTFQGMFPNIACGTQNLQKGHLPNGSLWNSPEQVSWLNNDNILNSTHITDSQKNNTQFVMKALQQLKIEDSLNVFNGHSLYSSPFTLRGQWPLASQCPPPGFVAPSRSPASTPFPHMPLNQKI